MKSTIDMAREAGFIHWEQFPADYQNKLKAFEALVRADERSGCAAQYLRIMRNAVVDAVEAEREQIIDLVAMYGGPIDLEAAIRARGTHD